jgi:hypothetical protein
MRELRLREERNEMESEDETGKGLQGESRRERGGGWVRLGHLLGGGGGGERPLSLHKQKFNGMTSSKAKKPLHRRALLLKKGGMKEYFFTQHMKILQ